MAKEQNNTTFLKLKEKLKDPNLTHRFEEMLGRKSTGFLTSLTAIVTNNDLLKKAEPNSIILAASAAAALDLPINPNLGLAAIIPFNDTNNKRCLAQMQIMRDGWVDLAMRSGQIVGIANEVVYEGELVSGNRFTGMYEFDETKRKSNKVIGYMAYIKLSNGFEKSVYWTVEQCKNHGMRYSQTFKKGKGLWKDNFEAMALKTVLKHLLKKYAPKSIEILGAIEADQATFSGDIDNPDITHIDNIQDAVAEEVVDVPEEVTSAVPENVDTETGEVKQPEQQEQTPPQTEETDF